MNIDLKHCVRLLQENEESVQREAQNVLYKMCNNILKNPSNARYRKVRLTNPIVERKLLPAFGAIECLFGVGFIEGDDGFSLPDDAPLSAVEELQQLLRPKLNNFASKSFQELTLPSTSKDSTSKLSQKTLDFFNQMKKNFQGVLRYEDPKLQERARLLIPLVKLELAAMEKMRTIQRGIKLRNEGERTDKTAGDDELTIDDLLLTELLGWFKNEFFKWVNSPSCNISCHECTFNRIETSTDSRISKTEIHRCNDCGNEVKFHRYTDPGILLSTREGRCGEWANAFTLICRSLGYDARLVVDVTDHVWTEIWSVANKRWIHADACENVIDRPLMYEKGWKKKLSYVIAYSKDEVQDVTWRYTRDQKSVMKRRNLCSEESLINFILRLNDQRLESASLSLARKEFIIKRKVLELVDMFSEPPGYKTLNQDEDDNYEGRSSGSLAWRLARGESQVLSHKSRKWMIPSGVEEYELRYFIVENFYEARDLCKKRILEKRNGWHEGLEKREGGIFRKEENDWKMLYLARSPGEKLGVVSWTFETSNFSMTLNRLSFSAKATTFEGGIVEWKIQKCYLERENEIELIENYENFETQLEGASRVSLEAVVSGGRGNASWQHAQLFRQSINSKNEHSMVIKITTKERQS